MISKHNEQFARFPLHLPHHPKIRVKVINAKFSILHQICKSKQNQARLHSSPIIDRFLEKKTKQQQGENEQLSKNKAGAKPA